MHRSPGCTAPSRLSFWCKRSVENGHVLCSAVEQNLRATKRLSLLQLISEGRPDSVYSDPANGFYIFMSKLPSEVCLEPTVTRVVSSRQTHLTAAHPSLEGEGPKSNYTMLQAFCFLHSVTVRHTPSAQRVLQPKNTAD